MTKSISRIREWGLQKKKKKKLWGSGSWKLSLDDREFLLILNVAQGQMYEAPSENQTYCQSSANLAY